MDTEDVLSDRAVLSEDLQAALPDTGDHVHHGPSAALAIPACRKCGGAMAPGKFIAQTYSTGSPDFPGDSVGMTLSPGGPGVLCDCLKCSACGWSTSLPALSLPALPAPHRHGGTYESSPFTYFTAEQMREFALVARSEALEEAAKLCETLNQRPFGSNAYVNGVRDGSIGCANEIRALAGTFPSVPVVGPSTKSDPK